MIDRLADEARLDRLDDGVGRFDREPGEAALRIDLFLHQRHAVGNDPRAVARNQENVFERRHGGESTPPRAGVVRMAKMGKIGRLLPSPRVALAVLTGLNFLNYLDRFLPFAVLPALSADLHLSDARAGVLQTLFMVSYMVMSPVAGWLGDRGSRFGVAAVGVLIWSAATFGSGLAPAFLALALARALTGVGEASYVAAARSRSSTRRSRSGRRPPTPSAARSRRTSAGGPHS